MKMTRKNMKKQNRTTMKKMPMTIDAFHGLPMIYGGTPGCGFYKKYIGKTIYLGINIFYVGGQMNYRLTNCILPRYKLNVKTRYGDQDLFKHYGFNWKEAETMFYSDTQKMTELSEKNDGNRPTFNEEYFIDLVYEKLQVYIESIFKAIIEKNKKKDTFDVGKFFLGVQVVCSINNVAIDSLEYYKNDLPKGSQIHFKLCELIVPYLAENYLSKIDALLLFGDEYGKHDIPISSREKDYSQEIFKILREIPPA
jgi:hypothetical protein